MPVAGNRNILLEVWDYLRVRKAWWLTPLVIMFIIVAALIVFSQGSALSPFIYALV